MFAWYALSLVAGVSFVFQQGVNSELRMQISSPWWAGFVSYLGGTFVMLMMALALREPLQLHAFAKAPWLSWTGGFFGAIYIGISILTLPRLGATTTIALLILGQMIGSLVFDHFGLLGLPIQLATFPRMVGVALVIAGVALTRF
jgi:transporter family-2 protein